MSDYVKKSLTKVGKKRVSRELVVIFVVFAALVAMFAKLADEVLEHDTIGPDVAILHIVHNMSSPLLDRLVSMVTNVGGPIGGVVLSAVIVTLIWLRGKKRESVVVGASVAGAAILNLILKAIFLRPRPEEWARIVDETSYSFPSGHAMASAALSFALIAVTWRTRWRWPVVITSVAYMITIAFTRLYLGVHYPTDILAGWVVSAAWVIIVVVMWYVRLSKHSDLTK